jgi:hypothetical protein
LRRILLSTSLLFYVLLIWGRHHSRWRAGLQNLGLCSHAVLRAFEQEGIFIGPHLLWHWISVFPVSSEGPPHSVTAYDTRSILTGIMICIRFLAISCIISSGIKWSRF